MSLEQLLNLHYQAAELLTFGFLILALFGMAFLWLRWHEAANLSAEAADGEMPARSTVNSFSLTHRSLSRRHPRFLFLGASAQDAQAAFDGLAPCRAFERTAKFKRPARHDTSEISHFLFNGGEIVAVSDNLFTPGHPDLDSGKQWIEFLTVLKRSRSRRPLDGLILNLPANLLTGQAALSAVDLFSRANGAARQLQTLRKQIGFSLPVYLLITGCEAIEGFAAFVQAQDKPDLKQILGWSSPYRPEAAFASGWIAQAFAEVERKLARLRLEWFAQTARETNSGQTAMDELFLFPGNFRAIESPVTGFLQSMFDELGQRDAVEFRGLYFSAGLSHSIESPWQGESLEPQFTLDLLQAKILPERVLARPADTAFVRGAAASAAACAACVAAALMLGFGTLLGWYHLQDIRGSPA